MSYVFCCVFVVAVSRLWQWKTTRNRHRQFEYDAWLYCGEGGGQCVNSCRVWRTGGRCMGGRVTKASLTSRPSTDQEPIDAAAQLVNAHGRLSQAPDVDLWPDARQYDALTPSNYNNVSLCDKQSTPSMSIFSSFFYLVCFIRRIALEQAILLIATHFP